MSDEYGVPTWITLDGDGYAHLTFRVRDGVRYATNRSGDWVVETVDPSTINAGGTHAISLVLDSSGAAHIAYFSNELDELKIATNRLGSWVVDVPFPGWAMGMGASVALDTDEHVQVACQGENGLVHVTDRSGDWSLSLIDPGYPIEGVGHHTGLAIDGVGMAHVSYQGLETLLYATFDATSLQQ